MFDTNDIAIEFVDENAKCKRIAFNTSDETLVRTALTKLGCKPQDFRLTKTKFNWEPKQQRQHHTNS